MHACMVLRNCTATYFVLYNYIFCDITERHNYMRFTCLLKHVYIIIYIGGSSRVHACMGIQLRAISRIDCFGNWLLFLMAGKLCSKIHAGAVLSGSVGKSNFLEEEKPLYTEIIDLILRLFWSSEKDRGLTKCVDW